MLRPALVLLAGFTLLTGVIYPVLVTGLARAIFPHQAGGSLLRRDHARVGEHARIGEQARVDEDNRVGAVDPGDVVGSALIGQRFTDPRYFWGRPSATGPTPYNAAASGASNHGPRNPALHDAVRERVAALRAANPDARGPVPADLATASASGLDPHISPEAARFQAARVAAARRLSAAEVLARIDANTLPRTLGVLGEPRVDVLRLNRDLDAHQR